MHKCFNTSHAKTIQIVYNIFIRVFSELRMNITRNGRSQEILLKHLKSRSNKNLPNSCSTLCFLGHPAICSPNLLLQVHSFDQPPLDDGPALADGVHGLVGVHGPDGVHYLDLSTVAADGQQTASGQQAVQICPLVPGELAT